MAMTKKDYELVATALRSQRLSVETRVNVEYEIIDQSIETIAAHFALMNDKFNKDTFLEAANHGSRSNN